MEVLALRQQVAVLKRKRPRPTLKFSGPTVLDDLPRRLVSLGGCPRHRETRDCDRLASRWLSPLLALAVQATRRQAENHRRNSSSDPTLGGPESGVGSAEDIHTNEEEVKWPVDDTQP